MNSALVGYEELLSPRCNKIKEIEEQDIIEKGRWSDPMAITTYTYPKERRSPSTCLRHESPQSSAEAMENSIPYRR